MFVFAYVSFVVFLEKKSNDKTLRQGRVSFLKNDTQRIWKASVASKTNEASAKTAGGLDVL